MSVIANLPVLPNRLNILLRQFSRSRDGFTRDELAELMSTPSLGRGKTSIFSAVLAEALRLGLVVETAIERGGNRLLLADDAKDLALIDLLERRLLQDAGNESWDRGRFPEALAWFLMQDPMQPLMWDKNVRLRVVTDLGEASEALELTNKARFQNLVYWARFLGYAVKLGFSAIELGDDTDVDDDDAQAADLDAARATAYVLPDPTEAIARRLPAIFRTEQQLKVEDFIKVWAPLLPVLEGGAIREQVEQQARAEIARQPKAFSRATSLALRRLEQRRLIALRTLSDAQMYLLYYGRESVRVSHIAYLGEKSK